MSGVIWSKFFWSDWQSEPALRLCSYAARGLWMDMLCIAAAHDPIGYVAVAGRGLDETSIARMTGGTESEVASLLGELDRNGVFSRDRQGRIYSRRMVSDARKAATARKNGKLGGNPTLGNHEGKSGWDNPPVNGGVKPHKPLTSNHYPEGLEPERGEVIEPQRRHTAPPTKGSRLKADWQPSAENVAFAMGHGFTRSDVDRMADRFRNYWLAKAGRDAVKLDWSRTWQNWASTEAERRPKAANGTTGRVDWV